MFGFLRKKFDAKDHLEILLFDGATALDDVPEEGTFRLVTSGLAKWDRREVEIVGVPAPLYAAAAVVLRRFATQTVTKSRIEDRQTFAGEMGPFVFVVRSFETTSHGVAVSRLGDALAAELPQEPPRTALTTLNLVAALAEAEEAPDDAKHRLLDSIEFFPGAPDTGADARIAGRGYNTENFLTYLALASIDSAGSEVWLRSAFERSSEAIEVELGVADLPEVPKDQLRRDAAQLIVSLQTSAGGEPWGPERMRADGKTGAEIMAMVPSPLVQKHDDRAVRFVSPMPFPFRSYFYESPVRELLRSDAVLDVVAEVYAAMRAKPARVLAQTAEARELYRGKLEPTAFGLGEGEPELTMPMGIDVPEHLPALSRIVADVGRLLAADLSPDELRAHYRLSQDGAALERTRAKLEALDEQEGKHFGAAVGIDLGAL